MTTFIQAIKKTTKTEWCVCILGILFFFFLFHFSSIPRFVINPFAYGFAASLFLYYVFFKKNLNTVKNRLYSAMIAGAFIYLFIESISKLFAKWSIGAFF